MKRFSVLLVLCLLLPASAWAKDYQPIYPGFPGIRESKAYQKFSTRPLTDFSKILYLIDRFGEADISINYDDQTYTAKFTLTVARWFLARNYKKQTVPQWVNQWCHKSIMLNKPIYVKTAGGKFLKARDVLLEEAAALDEVIKENMQRTALPPVPVPEPQTSQTPKAPAGEPAISKGPQEVTPAAPPLKSEVPSPAKPV